NTASPLATYGAAKVDYAGEVAPREPTLRGEARTHGERLPPGALRRLLQVVGVLVTARPRPAPDPRLIQFQIAVTIGGREQGHRITRCGDAGRVKSIGAHNADGSGSPVRADISPATVFTVGLHERGVPRGLDIAANRRAVGLVRAEVGRRGGSLDLARRCPVLPVRAHE